MSKTSGIKEAYDLIYSFVQDADARAERVDHYPRKLVEAAKDWMSQNIAFLARPIEVKNGGKYWTEDGNPVEIWNITQDDGCYCSDLKYHCASTLRDRE